MTDPVATSSSKRLEKEECWRVCLEGIRARKTEALAQLYDETSSLLYGLAMRVLNNPSDAEEVVLDVYQQVWRSSEKFDPDRGTLWGWLTVLTRSRAIDRLRSIASRQNRELPIEPGYETRSNAPLPEEESIFSQERDLVRRALEMLAPEQREAIELAFFRGLTHAEIAEAMGAPLGTIKTRLRIGMRKMSDLLAPSPARGNP